MELNGLALEYQGNYGTARGDLDIADLVNNPAASGKCHVFGLGLPEKSANGLILQVRPLTNDRPNALMVGARLRGQDARVGDCDLCSIH